MILEHLVALAIAVPVGFSWFAWYSNPIRQGRKLARQLDKEKNND